MNPDDYRHLGRLAMRRHFIAEGWGQSGPRSMARSCRELQSALALFELAQSRRFWDRLAELQRDLELHRAALREAGDRALARFAEEWQRVNR